MRPGWRPNIGDFVAARFGTDGPTGRYVIRGTSGDRVLLCEVWCEGGKLRESPRRREVRWSDVRELRPVPPPDC